MSVKIRFARVGKKHRPFFKLVAIDSRKKRDGQYLDNIGTFDPIKNEVVHIAPISIAHQHCGKNNSWSRSWISLYEGCSCTEKLST